MKKKEYAAIRNPNIAPNHPGELLALDVLPALGKSQQEIANMLGVSRQVLHRILNAQAPITPETAVKIGKLCGNGPRLWLNMQASYDLWHAEQTVDVSKIPTLEPA